jgi:hypothetical protein
MSLLTELILIILTLRYKDVAPPELQNVPKSKMSSCSSEYRAGVPPDRNGPPD